MVQPTPAKSNEALEKVYKELDEYVEQLRSLFLQDPDDAMKWISSVSARLLELIFQSLRNDTRPMTRLRVEWLLPFQQELRFQWQLCSRRISAAQLEWEQAK
jgi:hypothetical protein